MARNKKQIDSKRYRLHYLIKRLEPEDYKNLIVRQRTFIVKPKGTLSRRLINEFQYVIQTEIK